MIKFTDIFIKNMRGIYLYTLITYNNNNNNIELILELKYYLHYYYNIVRVP